MDVLSRFFTMFPVLVLDTHKEQIVQSLARYETKPWRKRSMYLSLRSFRRWASANYGVPNPFLDQFGNPAMGPAGCHHYSLEA